MDIPFCAGKRRDYLRAATDDGAVPHRAGNCWEDCGRCWIREHKGEGTYIGDYYSGRGLRSVWMYHHISEGKSVVHGLYNKMDEI